MSGIATFIEECDSRAGFTLFVESVDVDVTTAVVSSEQKTLITIKGEVGIAVVEGEGSVVLVATVGFESDDGGRRGSFVTYVGRDIEQRLFRVGHDGGRNKAKVDFFVDGEGELVALLCGVNDP